MNGYTGYVCWVYRVLLGGVGSKGQERVAREGCFGALIYDCQWARAQLTGQKEKSSAL